MRFFLAASVLALAACASGPPVTSSSAPKLVKTTAPAPTFGAPEEEAILKAVDEFLLAVGNHDTEALKQVMVAEGNAGAVHPGLTVRFEDALAGLRGRVERVHPAVSGGSVELDVELDDRLPAGARPDQAVTGYVEFGRAEKVVVVARPANVRDGTTAVVFRLDADGRHATRKSVRFGTGSLREVAITQGLSPGDEIVISDTSAWNDSDRVRLE